MHIATEGVLWGAIQHHGLPKETVIVLILRLSKDRRGRPVPRRHPCALLDRLHRRERALLRILERSQTPLHTNGSENAIRACVTKRKISGGIMSEAGRTARDVVLGLMKTCAKLKLSFFRYLGDRLGILDQEPIPPMPDLVRQAANA